MIGKTIRRGVRFLLAGLIAGGLGASPALSQEPGTPSSSHADPGASAPAAKAKRHARAATETSASWREKHALYFKRNWGIDIVGVRRVASGFMLRFDYRVVDPDKASALTDKKARPYLIDERTRTALAVPAMENVGELRQVAPLEYDRTYYVIFGNPGGLVKKGGKVTLMVGNFKAEGLVVD